VQGVPVPADNGDCKLQISKVLYESQAQGIGWLTSTGNKKESLNCCCCLHFGKKLFQPLDG